MHDATRQKREKSCNHQCAGKGGEHDRAMRVNVSPSRCKKSSCQKKEREQGQNMDWTERPPETDRVDEETGNGHLGDQSAPDISEGSVGPGALGGQELK